jgi:hypothetical protein
LALFLYLFSFIIAFEALLRPPAHSGSAAIQAELEQKALRYFIDNANPVTGLVRDAAENFGVTPSSNRVASIAATGFGLAVIANASFRGIISKKEGLDYCSKTILFSRAHVARHAGWFLHFIDWETGARVWESEYSTIDTALFMGGALYAAQVFPELAPVVNELYRDLDFNLMMTDAGKKPLKKTLSMAYTDEQGFTNSQWDMFGEQMLLLILGLGHPEKPLPVLAWQEWKRPKRALPGGESIMGGDTALFIHQYSELFIDLRTFEDSFGNYFDNARKVSRWQRSLRGPLGFWGWSAGQSQTGYAVWSGENRDGTICLGCALGSAMYLPHDVIVDAGNWKGSALAGKIWGRYGFIDSLNVEHNWFSSQVLGITVGPIYLSLANTNEATSVWHLFMQNPEINNALNKISRSQASTPLSKE